MAFYSRRHYAAVSAPRDTPEALALRLRNNAVLAAARADVAQAYPVITAENVDAALAFQTARIAAHWAAGNQ